MTRVALVTGASRGIGRAVAVLLAAAGHAVAVNGRSPAGVEGVVAEIEASGGTALGVPGDVGDAGAVADVFGQVDEQLGTVAVLVNNAGITRDGLLLRMSEEDWDEVLRVDLRSVFLCSRAAARPMVRARWGRIISIGSVAGLYGNPGQANYAAAKAGIVGFTRTLARELGGRGITVNTVAPGFIATDMTDALGEEARAAAADRVAAGRFGTPEEVAALVGYLASDEAAYVNGQTIAIDGGLAL